jgi:type I restriction enzyme M protein
LRANSDLKSSEYATPVLGLIFLKFADNNYLRYEQAINEEYQKLQGSRREKPISEIAIAQCGFYLPDNARYDYLLNLPEQEDIATLWFFDKGKQDNRILFIDARNIFTQIDRAHREFSEEQIQNIAIISKLYKGNRQAFINLIDSYFDRGMALLLENQTQIEPISQQLLEVLADEAGKQAVSDLVGQWKMLAKLEIRYQEYLEHTQNLKDIDGKNKAQHELREAFDPFFTDLHQGLKQLDKIVRKHEKAQAEAAKLEGKRSTTDREMKKLKEALEALHQEVKVSESCYKHIHWLQERFPQAEYEDVTGLCKLATLEEVKEQDYSLNPGRYVGVVIEEDGKTEEEFILEMLNLNEQLNLLNSEARELEKIISTNILKLVNYDDEEI